MLDSANDRAYSDTIDIEKKKDEAVWNTQDLGDSKSASV
jgi:hypothetical protein